MRCVLLIAAREFSENVRTKGFWFGLLLFPALIVLGGTLPVLLARKATPTRTYVLVDLEGGYGGLVRGALAREETDRLEAARQEWRRRTGDPGATDAGFTPPRPRFREVPPPDVIQGATEVAAVERVLRPLLAGPGRGDSALFAAVVIPPGFGPGTTNELRYWSVNQADSDLRNVVERVLREEFRRREYARLGLDPEAIRRIERIGLPVATLNPRKAEGEEKVGLSDSLRQWAPSLFVYLLWVGIFAISQMLLNGVVEEKGNRIIEVLLSSVTPGELMMGKLAGIAAVGLVMVTTWLGSLVGVALWGAGSIGSGPAAGLTRDIVSVLRTTPLLPGFLAYFLLGYLLYAAVFLTAGSLCNTLKEAQNLMAPLMLVLMVPLFLLPFIPRDPNGTLATVLSWVPWYTPFVMLNRLGADPPLRDVVGTLLWLAGFTGLVLWGCGRIFRRSILRTGQPPRWLELWRWLRDRV